MSKKADFSKKILTTLSGKKAVSLPELRAALAPKAKAALPAETYAVTRSIKNLAETGLIETLEAGQGSFARLTQKGRQKLSSLRLDNSNSLSDPNWDGKWRIVLLDLPESRKQEREALRYLLKKAGFILLKNSAWVSPFPFEFLFENIKDDFGLTSELMIIVTNQIDTITETELRTRYGMM